MTPQRMRVTKAGTQYLVVETDAPERWIAVFNSAVYAVAFVADRPYLDIVQVTGLQWVQR